MEKEVRYKKLNLTFEQKKNLTKPIVRRAGPYKFSKLVEGKNYWYCTCGISSKDPFCDGTHKGSKFKCVGFVATADEIHVLCGCKQNKGDKNPYCDGSHNECGAIEVEDQF